MSDPAPSTWAADLIKVYQEANEDTRRAIDRLLQQNQTERTRQFALDVAGMACGFVLAVAFLIAAVILGLNGAEWAASIIGGFDVGAVVSIFVLRRRS